jgi:hypothetical protein
MIVDSENHNNNNTIDIINWNDIIKQDTRSLDDEYLGKVKGLYEPFIVIERGKINKEKFYIPKPFIKKYYAGALYFSITEQEARDTYRRKSPPTEDEIRQMETITENRIIASRSNLEITKQEVDGEDEHRVYSQIEERKMMKFRKYKDLKESLATTISSRNIEMPRIYGEEIIKKLRQTASKLKDILISGAKVATEKIKKGKDIIEEKIKRTTRVSTEKKS